LGRGLQAFAWRRGYEGERAIPKYENNETYQDAFRAGQCARDGQHPEMAKERAQMSPIIAAARRSAASVFIILHHGNTQHASAELVR